MGEFELLAALRSRLPATGPRVALGSGDDAAVTVPGGATATSVDAIVDGVHFRRERTEPEAIGRQALAAALSDLAAMGAEPGEAYVALGVPPDLDEPGCLRLLDGLLELAAQTGTTLAGGDVTRSPVLSLAVTVVGHAPRTEDFVTRAGARAGDTLVVTGQLGAAAAHLLSQDLPPKGMSQFSPPPGGNCDIPVRLGAGRGLAGAGARAMIDLSDGLGGDARHLAEASGVGLRIDAAALPLAPGVEEVARAAGRDPLTLAISGGEDYELLAALPPERLAEARAAVEGGSSATEDAGGSRATEDEGEATGGVRLTEIGVVVAAEDGAPTVEIRLPDGGLAEPVGFDQLG